MSCSKSLYFDYGMITIEYHAVVDILCLEAVVYGWVKWCTQLKIGLFIVNIKLNMYLCIFTATVMNVYKHDKQNIIVY